jgi:hypothetical protein
LDLATRSDSIAFDKVIVRDGRVRIAFGGVAELDIGGIDLDAEVSSLSGPFKGVGQVPGPGRARLAFNFATGPVEGANLRLKAVVDAGTGLPRGEFDGALSLIGAKRTSSIRDISYSGGATFSGQIAGVKAPTPWRASGALKADLSGASLDDLDVRLGPEDRALAANGSVRAEFGATPQMKIVLEAKQLNLDTLLRVDGEDSATPLQAYEALRAASSGLKMEDGPPFAISFELSTSAAILGGDTIADVSLSAAAGADTPITGKLEATPPGRSHILATGSLDLGAAPGFKGRVDADVGDMLRLREWLVRGAPDMAARFAAIGDVLPYRSASATGDVELSAAGFAARNLNLVLERSKFTGALAVTQAVGADRGRLFMDLQTDALDLDSLPNIGASGEFLRDIDLSLALDARALRIARVGEGQVDGGSLALKLTRTGDEVRLEHLSIADLGGASVEANGAIDAKGRSFNAKIDAARLRDFALLVRRVAPGPVSDVLVDRSGALSPARLVFSAQSAAAGGNAASPADSLTVQGTAGVTRVEAKFGRAGEDGMLNATVSLDAPDAAPLLRQIGLPALSLAGLGRGHVGASVQGRWGDNIDGDISASFAGSDIAWRGRLSQKAADSDNGAFEGSGGVKAGNVMPLLAVLGIAPPDSTVAIPVDLSADTTWRGDRLGLSRLQGAAGHARFAGELTYWPTPARPSAATPADPDVALAQAVTGDAVETPAPQLEGVLSADRLSLSTLAGLALGAAQPAKTGSVWSDAKFAPGLVNPPSADIALKIEALDVTDNLLAHNAAAQLKLGRGLVSLSDFSMSVAGGAVTGQATIRRDGANASLSGQASIAPIAIDRPNFAGQLSGAMDFASTGQSAGALVAGLAGTGQIHLAGARVPRLDQDALGRIIEKAQSSDYAIDQTNVGHALELELNKRPLLIADASASASLTGGIIRSGPFEARNSRDDAALQASFDIRSFVLEIRVALTELQTPKYWSGTAPAISVVLKGPLEASNREVDSSLFVAGLAAQAIARETDRIAILESDIRERAFFNRRLKAGQFMRRRERELESYTVEQARLKSEADRRRVEIEALKADEERRATEGGDQSTGPNDPLRSATSPLPPSSQPPMSAPHSSNAPPQADPTATGLY